MFKQINQAVGYLAIGTVVVTLLTSGCASTRGTAPRSPISAQDRPYIISPLEGYPLTVGPATERRIQQGYQDLVTSGDPTPALTLANELLTANPGLHPASVLAAQADFIGSRNEAVLEQLRPVVSELPEYTSGWLLYGRVSERLDDVVGALLAYSKVSSSSRVAADQVERLRPRGAQILLNRIESDLASGRIDDAMRSLEQLQAVASDDPATLHAVASVARANNDPEIELEALRALNALSPEDRSIIERRAELELEVGDASDGMRLMRGLVAAYPEDSSIEEKAARAEFLWRLQLLPPDVQAMARQGELNRGDFATLIFWLFPEVRYGRAGSARIANDILDHPHRDEIVRVINLGLMDVDPSLHRFEPYRAVQRVEAFSAMTRLLAQRSPPPVCLGSHAERADPSRQQICTQASQCRLIPSFDDCLPTAALSGLEAVDLLRSSQQIVGDR